MARLLEQRLRLLGVVLALWELVARVRGIERRVDVVADEPVAGEALLHGLRAVDEEPERPPHPHVVERRRRRPACTAASTRRSCGVDPQDLLPRPLTTGTCANGTSAMASTCPDRSALTFAASDGKLMIRTSLKYGWPSSPVVLVLHVDALASGREALDLERPGPDVLQRPLADGVRLVALRDDALEVLRERLHQRDVGPRQDEPARSACRAS